MLLFFHLIQNTVIRLYREQALNVLLRENLSIQKQQLTRIVLL